MTNLLIFYGSCGHVTQEEVSSDEWVDAAENNYTIVCSDGYTRMVYVRPRRFFLCVDCIEEDIYCEEFATLRFFFQSPVRDSPKHKMEDLILEKDAQLIALGKSMFPSFSEEKILRIARKVVLNLS